MSNPKKPTQRPQKGRVRPANKPSGSGETGPTPEVLSGCNDSSSQEEPTTSFFLHLDLLLKCEFHVLGAISDDPKLVDATIRFRAHLPGLLHRLWELQSEKLAITEYLHDSSAEVVRLCEEFPGLPATHSANEVARKVFRDFAELVEHQLKSLSELENAINSVVNGYYPMTPD